MKRYLASASWCAQCKILKNVLKQADVDFEEVDADNLDNIEWMNKHNIRSLPTVVIYNNGEYYKTVVGVKKVEEYV